jgi:hypothetical protein
MSDRLDVRLDASGAASSAEYETAVSEVVRIMINQAYD